MNVYLRKYLINFSVSFVFFFIFGIDNFYVRNRMNWNVFILDNILIKLCVSFLFFLGWKKEVVVFLLLIWLVWLMWCIYFFMFWGRLKLIICFIFGIFRFCVVIDVVISIGVWLFLKFCSVVLCFCCVLFLLIYSY